MKKTIYFFACAMTILLALSSCKNDATEPDVPLTFSTLPVEQQKASVEKNCMDLADKMTGFQQTQGYVTLTQFINNGSFSPAFVAPFRQLSANLVQNDLTALDTFNKQLRVTSNLGSEIWGTWNWNVTKQDFVKESAIVPNKCVLNFPANDLNSTVNNAILIVDYSESNVLVPEVSPAEFYPKSISVILKVGNVEALNAQYSGTYNSDGTPVSVLQTLVIGAYNWSASVTNTNTDVSANFTFRYNSDILLKYDIAAVGSFTADALKNSNNPEDVVKSGFMSFQIMNVAIYGGITDTKGFMAEGNALKPDSIVHTDQYGKWIERIYTKSYYDKEVIIFNKYLKFYGFFAAEKQKFADVEFYTNEGQGKDYKNPILVYTAKTTSYYPPTISVKYDYYDSSYSYNSSTGNYDYTYKFYAYATKTVYNSQPRLVLSDGSKITDFNKYANDNFKTVITKFESMLPK